MAKRLYIETWGCQMNQHQSEGLAGLMALSGYRCVDRLDRADLVLFNGCMVRQKAEDKLYGRIGAVIEEKRRRTVLLGVGGCLGRVRGRSLLERFPAIDFVFGATGHRSLPELVAVVEEGESGIVALGDPTGVEELPALRTGSPTAMVTITEGCSNFCSYCIVPFARGPMRSRAPDRILEEVERAVDEGAREVLLLGQNVNAYGSDAPAYGRFAALLAKVAATGIARVRFATSHPRDMSDDVLDVMASTESVCNHLHLPAQSGSDRMLAMMRRGYTVKRYLRIVEAARRRIDRLNITTDLIVGHPGETERAFGETMELVETVRFGSIFVAKYSPRPLTRSAAVEDDVSEPVKGERLERVLARQRRIALEENQRFVGREMEVLFDRVGRHGGVVGRADDHRTVVARGGAIGELSTVRIEGASAAGLAGTVKVRQEVEGRR